MNPLENVWRDVEGLVRKTVWVFHRYSGDRDVADLMGQACLHFVEACRSYNPLRGMKLSTYVRNRVWFGLLESHREKLRRPPLDDRRDSRKASFDFRELLEELSPDAAKVVQIATHLHSPVRRKRGRKSRRNCLRDFLRGMGWDHSRITRSFCEIETVLTGD